MKKILILGFIIGLIIFTLRMLTPKEISPKPSSPSTPSSPSSSLPSKPRVNREELLGYCGVSSYGKCDYDTDCYISGCNSEICQSKNEAQILSACVILDCHQKPVGISCGCKDGECQWRIKIQN